MDKRTFVKMTCVQMRWETFQASALSAAGFSQPLGIIILGKSP